MDLREILNTPDTCLSILILISVLPNEDTFTVVAFGLDRISILKV